MDRDCRLIHSFTNGSSLSTFSGKCQPFQEKVDFEKKHCQPFQEIFPKSVNQNQEKTNFCCSVAVLQFKLHYFLSQK